MEEEHLWDVAVQAYVLHGAGVRLEDTCLLHMNSDYVRVGELDLKELFTEVSVMQEVEELQDEVEQSVASSKEQLVRGEVPEQDIGAFCAEPRPCDFKGHCWEQLPSPSVFDVYYIGKRAFDLYAQGITRIEKIPDDHPLDKRSRFHIQAHKSGETIIHQKDLLAFIAALDVPLYYLDFETFALPIPPFEGLSPYSKVPFQYSLHVQAEAGGEVVHSGFLAEAGVDPRREFLSSLLSETEGLGSIIVYYQSFERSVLAALGEQYPHFKPAIDGRIERFVDLWDPFRKQQFYTPAMGGSTSLKSVLPALVPEMRYDDLEISDGNQAMEAYLSLVEMTDPEEIERIRGDLWEYCQLDTLAMVRILEELRKVCEG